MAIVVQKATVPHDVEKQAPVAAPGQAWLFAMLARAQPKATPRRLMINPSQRDHAAVVPYNIALEAKANAIRSELTACSAFLKEMGDNLAPWDIKANAIKLQASAASRATANIMCWSPTC